MQDFYKRIIQPLGQDRYSAWTMLVMAIAVLISLPVLTVLSGIFRDTGAIWQHLAATVLATYITNSLGLMVGVGLGVVLIGTGTAWLVTMCRFPGRWMFEWGLLLPLAAPAYILAYTYTELLEFYGPVQTSLRGWFGWQSVQDYWFPDIRSLWGAIALLTLTLYPYVYLLVRTAFLSQSASTLEACRMLGCGPWQSFLIVALPLARPAIMAGLSLALMETLNDYGTVQYFAVDTFTTGIYRTWFGMGEQQAASQLSAFLLLFILALVLLERGARGQAQYYQTAPHRQPLAAYSLRGWRAIAAQLACFLPIGLGLLFPGAILLQMTLENWSQTFNEEFWGFAYNSLLLALLTAGIAVAIALLMAYGLRLQPNLGMRLATQVAAMGYAVPGSVIAVGILVPVGGLDNAIDAWMRSTWGISSGLLLSGTIAALVFAYLVRFLAVSFSTIDASLTKIKPSLDDAARSLGHSPLSTLVRIHAPLMGRGLLTAVTLGFCGCDEGITRHPHYSPL
ncbi:iron ABC transporter permease [Neosynechococcus sphagnicola]|uniref:ABC transporter permease n=1 Tax=Neosynechococcus sphagnicola TaxID=1501145 RepID=UPI000ADB374F